MLHQSVLHPGSNCWRVAHANRASLLIDGANYFGAVASAMERARRSITVVGWELHSQMRLRRDGPPLASFLSGLVDQNPELRVDLLIWDPAAIYVAEREYIAKSRVAFGSNPRIRLTLDSAHPRGASLHEKIVSIDDGAVAFCGGFDLSTSRWDVRGHPSALTRRLPSGESYRPFHDAQMLVDGEAAGVLDDVVSERFRRVGIRRATPGPASECWPRDVTPDFEDVQVGVTRTLSPGAVQPAIGETEQLFLDAIASARELIYVENQYVSCEDIAGALAQRLSEPDGPEVVLVMPKGYRWIEQPTIGTLRDMVIGQLRRADLHDHLGIYYARSGDAVVNIHAKIMIVDDHLLHVGSANLTNRSMSLDSECGLGIEARRSSDRAAIARIRDGLVAEHVGAPGAEVVTATVQRLGSLRAAIAQLNRDDHMLLPLEAGAKPGPARRTLAYLADPRRPLDQELAERSLPHDGPHHGRRGLVRLLVVAIGALGLSAAWAWTPLRQWIDVSTIAAAVAPLREWSWGPLLGALAFVPASLLMIPLTVLIVSSVLVFGVWPGVLVALAGGVLAGSAGFGVGRLASDSFIDRWPRVARLSRALGQRGILAVVAVRLIPIGPFMVINLAAGCSHIRHRDFVLGTFIGLLPGIAALAVASDRIIAALRSPDWSTIIPAALIIAAAIGVVLGLRALLGWVDGNRGRGAPDDAD